MCDEIKVGGSILSLLIAYALHLWAFGQGYTLLAVLAILYVFIGLGIIVVSILIALFVLAVLFFAWLEQFLNKKVEYKGEDK